MWALWFLFSINYFRKKMSGASIHDSRKHPICPPFYGESGPAYTRVFRTDFVANLWSEVDEAGHSLAEHILGLDEGSPGNPIAGVAAYQAKAVRLRNTRSKKRSSPTCASISSTSRSGPP